MEQDLLHAIRKRLINTLKLCLRLYPSKLLKSGLKQPKLLKVKIDDV